MMSPVVASDLDSVEKSPPSPVGSIPPVGSIVLLIGGLFLLGWLGWNLAVGNGDSATAPYRYEMVAGGNADQFPDLGLKQSDLFIRKYELRSDGVEKPLVILHTGAKPSNNTEQVLLDWRNQLNEPLVTLTPPIDDLNTLSKAIDDHLPQESLVLGWWDTMRRLALVADIDTPLDENLVRPLLLPTFWNDHRDTIEVLEQGFWGLSLDVPTEAQALFERLQSALLADRTSGVEMLRELTQNRDTYLVLHVTDAYKLGMLRPEEFGIGYRDFPLSGNMHSAIGHIKKWLGSNGYESYTVDKLSDTSVRVFFLTDEQSQNPLIAQALPFTTSQPLDLDQLKIVYQHKGYWVYKVPNNSEGERKNL